MPILLSLSCAPSYQAGIPVAQLVAQVPKSMLAERIQMMMGTGSPEAPVNPFFKPPPTAKEDAKPGLARERKQLDEGAAEITWPDNLSAESFEEFEYWLQGCINRARRKAGVAPKSPAK
jgi:hypothetical protein